MTTPPSSYSTVCVVCRTFLERLPAAASIDLDGKVIAGSLPRLPCIEAVEELRDITAVEVVGDFRLRLTFDDGTVGDVEFADRAWRGVLEPLGDPAFFAQVCVDPESDTIAWPNGVDLAPEPLYEEARRNRVRHA